MRAVIFLAGGRAGEYVTIRQISSQLGISHPFLTKVLQVLTREGILHSFRGPSGGVALARAAEEISLKEIIVAIDGKTLFTHCALGIADCTAANPCSMHGLWEHLQKHLESTLSTTTVADIVRQKDSKGEVDSGSSEIKPTFLLP